METKMFNSLNKPSGDEKKAVVDFLYDHLENYGDKFEDIEKAIDYAVEIKPSFGGFVLTGVLEGKIVGVVVVNKTGMKGYIPENILVYIATHKDFRGKGLGKELMKKTIELSVGNIALHVEPDNPARFLYEKMGFSNKYLEMRFMREHA